MAKRKRTNKPILLGGLTAAEISKGLENTQVGKFHTKGGAGFAAEEANGLADKVRLRRVEMVGLDNAHNGTDRVVDGVKIQTKYYGAARETLQLAFEGASGLYRYDGNMLEVPKDQYDECLALLRQKIIDGKVPRYTNPDDAETILKSGSVTYKQARNIAQAGNIDSLLYDTTTQTITSNLLVNVSGLAGGVGGWMAGAGLGAMLGSVVPFVGTAAGGVVGGIVGAIAGGIGGTGAAKAGLDHLIEDDAKTMLDIVQRAVDEAAYDHLLLEAEIPSLVDFLKHTVSSGWLGKCFRRGLSVKGKTAATNTRTKLLVNIAANCWRNVQKFFCHPQK